jgi:NADPH:quinone reductase-like Zn-dependent oxidoreductase
MRVWEIERAWGIDQLRPVERPSPKPGPGEIVVRMRAASLNYRDLLMVEGKAGGKLPLIPFSDGAGEVAAVGAGVTRVRAGDRVCPLFFQSWLAGDVGAKSRAAALGGSVPGVLQEEMLLSAEGVAKIPAGFSFAEAATLPCAALTAWRALAVEGGLASGQTVLVQGTGGVSIFALQFAKLRGARVIVTSSSAQKLERARALGADDLIDYRQTPRWAKAALEPSGVGGHVLVIGVLSGLPGPVDALTVFRKNLRVIGISVGSREQFEAMVAAIEAHKLKPVIDRRYPVDRVGDALHLMKSGDHFGKICLEF